MSRYRTPPGPADSFYLGSTRGPAPECECWSAEEHEAGVCQGKADPWDRVEANTAPVNPASERSVNYLRDLMVGSGEAPDGRRAQALITTMFGPNPDQDDISGHIEKLKRQARKATGPDRRVNRYPGTCERCGGHVPAEEGTIAKVYDKWRVYHVAAPDEPCPTTPEPAKPAKVDTGLDLTLLPEGHYGVPGEDTRLKVMVRKPSKGKWAGWIFVSDAAAYGQRRNYGRQAPGETYRGDITDALQAIMADPHGAMTKYGELTNHCGNCNRLLEDETSVRLGIGPICRAKLAGELGWQF